MAKAKKKEKTAKRKPAGRKQRRFVPDKMVTDIPNKSARPGAREKST